MTGNSSESKLVKDLIEELEKTKRNFEQGFTEINNRDKRIRRLMQEAADCTCSRGFLCNLCANKVTLGKSYSRCADSFKGTNVKPETKFSDEFSEPKSQSQQ